MIVVNVNDGGLNAGLNRRKKGRFFKKIGKGIKKATKQISLKNAMKVASVATSFVPGGSIVGNVLSKATTAYDTVGSLREPYTGLGKTAAQKAAQAQKLAQRKQQQQNQKAAQAQKVAQRKQQQQNQKTAQAQKVLQAKQQKAQAEAQRKQKQQAQRAEQAKKKAEADRLKAEAKAKQPQKGRFLDKLDKGFNKAVTVAGQVNTVRNQFRNNKTTAPVGELIPVQEVSQSFDAPAQSFDMPAQTFDAPAQSFDMPAQSFAPVGELTPVQEVDTENIVAPQSTIPSTASNLGEEQPTSTNTDNNKNMLYAGIGVAVLGGLYLATRKK